MTTDGGRRRKYNSAIRHFVDVNDESIDCNYQASIKCRYFVVKIAGSIEVATGKLVGCQGGYYVIHDILQTAVGVLNSE